MNSSKSGVSLSAGRKGARVSVGPKGARVSASIPGTGISVSHKIGRSTRARTSSPSSKRTYGNTSAYSSAEREAVALAKEAERRSNARTVARKEEHNRTFVDIHKKAATVHTERYFQLRLSGLTQETYSRIPFAEEQPTAQTVNDELVKEADQQISTWMFWKTKQLKNEYIRSHFHERITQRTLEWEQRKAAHEMNQDETERSENARFSTEYRESKALYEGMLNGDPDLVENLAGEWLYQCDLPVEIDAQFQFEQDKGAFLIDLDLPEIEDMPSDYLVQLKSGALREKSKTQTELRGDYARCIFGLCIFVASHMFELSPKIERIILSAYTQRRNKIGDLQDDYIFSVKFTREAFRNVSFTSIDPEEFCMSFENRCLASKTKVFKTIKPFELSDL